MIKIKNVSFRYGEETTNGGIENINLEIGEGEFVVLTGSSGCGKTTVTRLINGLIPHYYEGALSGEVWVNDENLTSKSISQVSRMVSSVFQNPRSQFFSVDSTGELAFQLENRGTEPEVIVEKMRQVIKQFQIDNLMGRNLFELSGGEKQKLACAGVALADTRIVVLDEPSSNLDIYAIEELRKVLLQWKKDGKTIIISEHRLYYLRDLMDEMVLMEDGKITKVFSREEAIRLTPEEMNQMGLRTLSLEHVKLEKWERTRSKEIMKFQAFDYHYKGSDNGIRVNEFSLSKGGVVAVIGHNGAGKSTFAKCLCGLEKKCDASVQMENRLYKNKQMLSKCFMVMQDVNYQLFTESILDEVVISLSDYQELTEEERESRATELLDGMHLRERKDDHPMALSGGQKQRVAIACAVASEREIIFFDEPTSGLDYVHMEKVAEQIRRLPGKGITAFVITHDLELILRCCTHVMIIEKGMNEQIYELSDKTVGHLKEMFINM